MTYQEAIEMMKKRKFGAAIRGHEETAQMCELAIEALEKQIPKKPLREGYDYECRSCKCSLEFEDFYDKPREVVKYCVNCGQPVDWSDER